MRDRDTTKLFLSIAIIAIYAGLSAWLWPYIINTWLVSFGKEPVVVWWQGLLLGFVPGLGQASMPAAAITWILMLDLT